MTTTLLFLRKIQAGAEATKGVAVPATAQLVVDDWATPVTPGLYKPNQQRGILAEAHPGVQTDVMVDHSWSTELTFEQVLYALAMGVKGGVTPTGAGSEKTWTFAPALGGGDDFTSFTIEKRFTDGTTNYDYQYPYTLAKSIEINIPTNGVATMKVDMFSQKENSSALTGAIAAPALSLWEIAVGNLSKIFLDSSWANLGTTQIVGQVSNVNWKLNTGLDRRFYLDGQLPFSRHSRMKRSVELTITVDKGSYAATWRAAVTSRALQYVRVSLLGSTITTNPKAINLDGAYAVDPLPAESNRNGDDQVVVKFTSVADTTGAQDYRVIVVNTLSAIP